MLAIQLSQAERQEEALEILLKLLRKDLGFADGAAKQAFLDIVKTLGAGDPVATTYQRKLMTLMF